jgi:hypothetical protein
MRLGRLGEMEVRGNSPFPRSSISAFVSAVRQLEQRAPIRSSLRPIEIKTFINADSQHTEGSVVHHPFQYPHSWSPLLTLASRR